MQKKHVGNPTERKDPKGSSSGGADVEFPTLKTRSWPRLGEPVSHGDAIAAIRLGNAQILARYLRESSEQPHYYLVTRLLADLLDPASAFKSHDDSPANALWELMDG